MCAKTKMKELNPTVDAKKLKTHKEFGIANAWGGKTPLRIRRCRNQNHTVASKRLGNCYHEYSCDICNYTYSLDSSG